MNKRWLWVFVVVVVAAGAYVTLGRNWVANAQGQPTATPTPVAAPVKADGAILAEGRVVPAREAKLSLPTSGIVAQVLVHEGDRVSEGQLLARLNADRLEIGLREAEAGVVAAEAHLARAQAGPRSEDVAAAERAVQVAQAAVPVAEAGVAGARARLAELRAGATGEEVAIAERRIEEAKNALWGAQGQRDAICGRVQLGAPQADCDSANATVNRLEEGVRIAELERQRLLAGPKSALLAAAEADLAAAQGQLGAAQARVAEAEAGLARLQAGPMAEDIAIAQAQVEQARVNVARAQVLLRELELRAPFAGTVVWFDLQEGAFAAAGAPVTQIADLDALEIETTDLNELNVVRLQVGDAATLRFDALPELELEGHITRIEPLGSTVRGEIVYTVRLAPQRHEPSLRWNMTVAVTVAGDR